MTENTDWKEWSEDTDTSENAKYLLIQIKHLLGFEQHRPEQ